MAELQIECPARWRWARGGAASARTSPWCMATAPGVVEVAGEEYAAARQHGGCWR